MRRRVCCLLLSLVLLAFLAGCGAGRTSGQPSGPVDRMPALQVVSLGPGERLRVVATTSIVGDVVRNIGGERIELGVLLPLGADPHAFEPTPQDVALVADAHIVFANGAGLETFLERLLESAGGGSKVVPVSYGIELLGIEAGQEEEVPGEEAHADEGYDPHTWFDPNNVLIWADNIAGALGTLDPANAAAYEGDAAAYREQLRELHSWIETQVAQLPPAKRTLVTDHTTLTYFVHRYGFEQIGAVLPGSSTLAQPSAQALADLESAVRAHEVKAVFVGKTVNPSLAQRVAQDTGTQLVFLYTGSLGRPGEPAATYLDLMRYDVSAIIQALR